MCRSLCQHGVEGTSLLRIRFGCSGLRSDRRGHQMMLEGSGGDAFVSEESFNVSMDGDFSIQVLQKAFVVWDLQVVPLNSQVDPELENACMCHLQDH